MACGIADGSELVKLLLENGVRADSISMDGFSALHIACCSPASKATVELLLAKDTVGCKSTSRTRSTKLRRP